MFLVFVDLCNGFHRNSSPVLPLLSIRESPTMKMSNSVDDVEKLVDKPGTTNDAKFDNCKKLSFLMSCNFDRRSNDHFL